MKCEIITNKQGAVVGVKDSLGNPSKVFKALTEVPFIRNVDQAIDAYSYIRGKNADLVEDSLTIKGGSGQVYPNLKEAIIAGESTLDIGVEDGNNMVPAISVNISADYSTVNGTISALIKEGILTDQATLDSDGSILLIPEGVNDYMKSVTSEIVRDSSKGSMGAFKFQVGDDFNVRVVENTQMEALERQKKMTFQKLEGEFGVEQALLVKTVEEVKVSNQETVELDFSQLPDNELASKLVGFLNRLGVSMTTIEEYQRKYKLKNGVEPSARALADLANNIVAFRNGEIRMEDLTEEVSHFIIDSLDSSQKESLESNVHLTSEWAEFAETYFEVYSRAGLSGVALEQAVREEILGKILAKSLQDRFQRRQENTEQGGIIQQLREAFSNFFTRVSNFFKPSYQQELERFTANVYKNLMEDGLDVSVRATDSRKKTLYSATGQTSLQTATATIASRLKEYQEELRHKYSVSASGNVLAKYREVSEQLSDVETKQAILDLTSVANSHIAIVKAAIEKSKKDPKYFSQEENAVYQSMRTSLLPMLGDVSSRLDSKMDSKTKDAVKETMDKITDLMREVPSINTAAREALVERVIRKNNLTPEQASKYRDYIRSIATKAEQDTVWLHAHLGGLIHARDGILNLAGDVIERTQLRERQIAQPMIKTFLDKLEKAGFNPSRLNKLIYKGEIINEIDPDKLEKLNKTKKAEAYNKVTGERVAPEDIDTKLEELQKERQEIETSLSDTSGMTVVEVEKLKNRMATLDSILNQTNRLYREELSKRRESYYSQEHLDKMENFEIVIDGRVIKRSDISPGALELRRQFSRQISEIRRRASDNTGGLTQSDKAEIRALEAQLRNLASVRHLDGTLKKGIIETWNKKYKTYVYTLDAPVAGTLSMEDLSDISTAIGLQQLDLLNREFRKSTGQSSGQSLPQKFMDDLNSLSTEEEKWDFLMNNAIINFNQDFWDSFDPNEGLVARLYEELNNHSYSSQEYKDIEAVISDIRKYQSIIANIIKANKNPNNPSEVDTYSMDFASKAAVKEAQEALDSVKREAKGLLGVSETTELDIDSTVNEAYRQDLANNGIVSGDVNKEIDFILKHATVKGIESIVSLRRTLNKIKNGEPYRESAYIRELLNGRTDYDNVLLEEARKRVLPYYKRTEPVGYSALLERTKQDVANNVTGAVESFVNDNLLDVRATNSYYEVSNDNLNPKWVANKEAGREQWTKAFLDSVRNDEYFSRYGITDYNKSATKNLSEFKARQAVLDINDQSLELYGVTGSHNRYQLPQMLKTNARRIMDGSNKGESAKEIIKDWAGFREDDMDLGQDVYGNPAKKGDTLLTIPRYGLRKVKNQKDVTDELLLSYTWLAQQASLYKARKENVADMLALQDWVSSRQYAGKEAIKTNSYKMLESFINANYYGVKESFSYEVKLGKARFDIAKLARTFNDWVRFSNLAGVTVPLTSAVQGKVQETIEIAVREAVNPTAYKLAQAKARRGLSSAAAEVMKFHSKSEMTSKYEFYGVYNMMERFNNSSLGRAGRGVLHLSNSLHQLGNMSIATAPYTVILDYRIVGGKILTKAQYDAWFVGENKWETFPLFDDFVKVDANGITAVDENALASALGTTDMTEVKTLAQDAQEAIANRTASVMQRIDTQIPAHQKSLASRNAVASFFLMHMNWFLVALQNKTKHKHFNLSEGGQEQEGNWRTLSRLVYDTVSNARNLRKVADVWKEAWGNDMERRNIRRTLLELAVANTLAVMAVALANAVDDDDDPAYLVTWADYILTRVAVEQTSGTIGLPNQIDDIIKSPVAWTRMEQLIDVYKLVTGDEIVETGNYAGKSERYKWMAQNLPFIKDYHRFSDFQAARQTYSYFNINQSKLFNRYAWATHLANQDVEESED